MSADLVPTEAELETRWREWQARGREAERRGNARTLWLLVVVVLALAVWLVFRQI